MRYHAAFVLALLATSVAGCGSGSGDVGSSDSHPSGEAAPKRQVIEQADAICQRLNAEFAAHRAANLGVAEIVRLTPARVAGERRVVEELGKLTPPASIANSLREVIVYRRQLATELAQLGRAAKANDLAAIHVLTRSKERAHAKLSASATSAGIGSCSQIG